MAKSITQITKKVKIPLSSPFMLLFLIFIGVEATAQRFVYQGTTQPGDLLFHSSAHKSIGFGTENPSALLDIQKQNGIEEDPTTMLKITSISGMDVEGYISLMGYFDPFGGSNPVHVGIYQSDPRFSNIFDGSLSVGSGANIVGQVTVSEGLILNAALVDYNLPTNRYIKSYGPLEFLILPGVFPLL